MEIRLRRLKVIQSHIKASKLYGIFFILYHYYSYFQDTLKYIKFKYKS